MDASLPTCIQVYAPALARHVGSNTRLKPVSLALIVLCGGMSLGLISQAVQMTPPTKEEVWFPKGHMLARALEEPREQFLAGDDEMYTVGHLYFGLKDLDNSAFDRFDPSENRGDVQYDTDFSLEDPAAQARCRHADTQAHKHTSTQTDSYTDG